MSRVVFKTIQESEFEDLFSSIKVGIYPYVDLVYGWDDRFQQNRLKNEYNSEWFRWVDIDTERVGLICFKSTNDKMHLHFLIIFPEYQNQGYGKRIMQEIHDNAFQEGISLITLSGFSQNEGAIKFYQKLGYDIVVSDNDFVSMSLSL